jgi:peptide deformylase
VATGTAGDRIKFTGGRTLAAFIHQIHEPDSTRMTRLTILEYPDPRLRTVAQPVQAVDDDVRRLIDDMLETMYASSGIGLAATQVNVHRRVLVADVSEDHRQPHAFVNPEVIAREQVGTSQEGCLSVPGIFDDVERAQRIRVRALGRDGKPFELDAEGLLAVCIQHEIDHLDGKLFVDYLSELKRQRIRKKLEKDRKLRAETRAPERPRAPAI